MIAILISKVEKKVYIYQNRNIKEIEDSFKSKKQDQQIII